jgi:hypothetical protein
MGRTQAQNGTVMDQLLGPFLETPSSNYSRHSQPLENRKWKKKKKRPWTYQKYNKTIKQKQLRFSLGFSFPANNTFPEKESGDVREDRVAGKASTEREQLGG